MNKTLKISLALSCFIPSVAMAERFTIERLEEKIDMAHYMGWTCYESVQDNLITVECGSFIRFFENELAPLAEEMTEEVERSGSLMFRQIPEHRLDEMAYKQREIGELYVYADRLRDEALAGQQ